MKSLRSLGLETESPTLTAAAWQYDEVLVNFLNTFPATHVLQNPFKHSCTLSSFPMSHYLYRDNSLLQMFLAMTFNKYGYGICIGSPPHLHSPPDRSAFSYAAILSLMLEGNGIAVIRPPYNTGWFNFLAALYSACC